nr:MAG TPA: hypothetical protein [Caudoviricetes sp.]
MVTNSTSALFAQMLFPGISPLLIAPRQHLPHTAWYPCAVTYII